MQDLQLQLVRALECRWAHTPIRAATGVTTVSCLPSPLAHAVNAFPASASASHSLALTHTLAASFAPSKPAARRRHTHHRKPHRTPCSLNVKTSSCSTSPCPIFLDRLSYTHFFSPRPFYPTLSSPIRHPRDVASNQRDLERAYVGRRAHTHRR